MEDQKKEVRRVLPSILAYGALVLVFGLLWWTLLTASSLSDEEKQKNLESFDEIWTTIRDEHFDPELNGLDWEAVRDELRPQMEQADSRAEAKRVLDDLLSRLGQSHFAVIPSEAYHQTSGPGGKGRGDGWTGIDLRIIDNQALVTKVAGGSPAAREGVAPGWIILSVDGIEIEPSLDEAREAIGEKSWLRGTLAGTVYDSLQGPIGKSSRVVFLDGNDERVSLRLTRSKPPGERYEVGHLPPVYTTFESRLVGDGIGYIAFRAFLNPTFVMDSFNDAMLEFSDTPGLIIDLRGNGGGMGVMALGMMSWLLGESREIGIQTLRDTELKMITRPREEFYTGPVVVLVDELSGSGAEFFASGLQDKRRAYIIGNRTAGAVLGGNLKRLPSGDRFLYVISNYVSSTTGQGLEGVGVIPDLSIAPDRTTLLAGRDLALEAALDWLAQNSDWTPELIESEPFQIAGSESTSSVEREYDPRAAALMDGFVTASGGKKAWDRLQNRVTRAVIDLPDQSVSFSVTAYHSRPNDSYTVIDSEAVGRIEAGTKGDIAWSIDLMNGPQLKTGVERDFEIRMAYLDGIVRWRGGYVKAVYIGTIDLDGVDCEKIELTPRLGRPEMRFFAAASGLLTKVETVLEVPEGLIEIDTHFSDYREVDDVLVAHRQRLVVLGQERIITTESIEHNVELPPDLFDLPVEIQALVGERPAA